VFVGAKLDCLFGEMSSHWGTNTRERYGSGLLKTLSDKKCIKKEARGRTGRQDLAGWLGSIRLES